MLTEVGLTAMNALVGLIGFYSAKIFGRGLIGPNGLIKVELPASKLICSVSDYCPSTFRGTVDSTNDSYVCGIGVICVPISLPRDRPKVGGRGFRLIIFTPSS